MDHFAHVALALLATGAAVLGCACNDPVPKTKPASSAAVASVSAAPPGSAAPERTPRPKNPAPKAETFSVTTTDGVRIDASSWKGGDAKAPVVLLVHRLGGTRDEWTPLLERLFPVKYPLNVVALDLRGHGQSKSAKGNPKAVKGKISWQSFDQAAFEKMELDLSAVLAHVEKQKGGPPQAWLLVGSDIGATLVVRAAAEREGAVAGLALVSPGASLRGMDVYAPFSAVLGRPNLLLAGANDTVSYQPAKAMAVMSKTSKLVTFEARGHGAQFLGEERWEMWDELADWVEARVQTPAPAASANVAGSAVVPPSSSTRTPPPASSDR